MGFGVCGNDSGGKVVQRLLLHVFVDRVIRSRWSDAAPYHFSLSSGRGANVTVRLVPLEQIVEEGSCGKIGGKRSADGIGVEDLSFSSKLCPRDSFGALESWQA